MKVNRARAPQREVPAPPGLFDLQATGGMISETLRLDCCYRRDNTKSMYSCRAAASPPSPPASCRQP